LANRHIICFGNELHGDDGFGLHIYSQICRMAWPKDVQVFNAGIAGLDALRFLEDCRQAILVDALTNFGAVGEVYVIHAEDLADSQQKLTGHGLGIPYLLQALKMIRAPLPEILLVGVEITAVTPFFLGLSPKTAQAAPKTIRLLQDLLTE